MFNPLDLLKLPQFKHFNIEDAELAPADLPAAAVALSQRPQAEFRKITADVNGRRCTFLCCMEPLP